MTPEEIDQIEQRFADEHEERAADGWPGAWADRPVMLEVTGQMTPEERDELYEAGTRAFSDYLVETANRYAEFHAEAQTRDRRKAWEAFLEDTRGERRRFRTIVLAKLRQIVAGNPPG